MRNNRILAAQNGERFYHGVSCINCGRTEKYTLNASCVSCCRERSKARMKKDRAMIRALLEQNGGEKCQAD